MRYLGFMTKKSINLPFGRRLDVHVVKERNSVYEKPLLAEFKTLLKTRKGNKTSRFFSKIFERKRLKKIIGQSLFLFLALIPIIPQPLQAYSGGYQNQTYIETPVVTDTKEGVRFPVSRIAITQKYSFFHPGIDLDGATGDKIYPITAGKVEKISFSHFDYGNSILINHGNGTKSLYAHLSKINVSEGDIVTMDSVIGLMGATGRAYGDHLHLEIYEDSRRVNPLLILQ